MHRPCMGLNLAVGVYGLVSGDEVLLVHDRTSLLWVPVIGPVEKDDACQDIAARRIFKQKTGLEIDLVYVTGLETVGGVKHYHSEPFMTDTCVIDDIPHNCNYYVGLIGDMSKLKLHESFKAHELIKYENLLGDGRLLPAIQWQAKMAFKTARDL